MTPVAKTHWPVVLTAVLAGIAAALCVGKVPPAMLTLQTDLGFGLVTGGFIISVFNGLGMVLAVFIGAAADRLGRRRLVVLGLYSLIAGGVLGSLGGGLWLLLVSRFIEGIGFIAVAVAAPALVIASASERDRPFCLSLWSIFFPTGMALAMVLAPPVLAGIGWQGLWLVIAALTLLTALALPLATRGLVLPPPPTGRPWQVIGETVRQPSLLLLGLVFGAYAFQWVSLMVWLPTFLTTDLAIHGTAAALVTAAIVALNIPGNMAGGWLMRRGTVTARSLTIGGSLAMGLLAVGIFEETLPHALRLALCFGFSMIAGMVPASLFTATPRYAPSPRHMGAANGILMQGSAIGQFIGPPLLAASVALAGGGWSGALIPMVAAAALAAGAGALTGRVFQRQA